MKCSVCKSEIKENYCSKCGQYYKHERISIKTILGDLFANIFSIEKSFLKNIKLGLFHPKMLITNYWNGFRGYYYSPSKFLIIGSLLFLSLNLLGKDFLGIYVSSNFAQQFTILIFLIILYSVCTFIIYYKFKKNFFEHLILNIYTVSLWSIIFAPISFLITSFGLSFISTIVLLVYLFLIIIWNSRVFELSNTKRFIYVILQVILLITSFAAIYKLLKE
jgi:hypothetical protein